MQSDASSRIQTCYASASKLDTYSAGTHSYIVTATDVAGNTQQLTVNYTVFSKETYNLTINALASRDSSPVHMWTVIRNTSGEIVQTGFTPLTFAGKAGSTYIVTVSDYQSIKFINWENGNTSHDRAFTQLSSDVIATASYDTGSILRGFTSLTFAGTFE